MEYGFIERYQKGKEAVTGIAQEPWHFRYVGAPHAAIMTELDLSLEEYHDFLKQHPYRRKRFIYRNRSLITAVSYIATGESSTLLELNTDMPCTISGNNADGFVLTEWRSSDEKR